MNAADTPTPALEMAILAGNLPPPWFVPVEAPSCGLRIHILAEQTTDGIAREFVCDRIRNHEGKHRQVTDNAAGTTIEWSTPVPPGDS